MRRTSPEGRRTAAKAPSLPSSCAAVPAERTIWPPPPRDPALVAFEVALAQEAPAAAAAMTDRDPPAGVPSALTPAESDQGALGLVLRDLLEGRPRHTAPPGRGGG